MIALYITVWLFLLVGPAAILTRAIRRWWATSPRIDVPAWRTYVAIGAVVLVALADLSWLAYGIWSNVGSGGYNSLIPRAARFGFLAAPAALVASLLGKGKLRWPAFGLSAVLTFLWIFTTLALES